MNQIGVSLEVVSPVFLIIALGYFLRQKNIINESFIQMAMKVVFTICLPGLLFLKVSKVDISDVFSGDSLAYASVVFAFTFLMFFMAKIYAKKFIAEKSQGAFIQGSFRSNYIIIGYSVLYSLFGDAIISRMALLVIVVVPLYNVLGIWALSEDKDKSAKDNLKLVSKKVLSNPLIIGIVLGFVVAILKINVPLILESTISQLGATGTPLGLLGIGGYLTLDGLKSSGKAFAAVFFKIVLFPFLIVLIALNLKYNYMDTTLLFILFGSPAAISSFIMANALGGDSEMAANIVIVSTALSLITFIIGLSSLAMIFAV